MPQPTTPTSETLPAPAATGSTAPIWLQRLSLFVLVVFCIYLGGMLALLPWWRSMWDLNPLFLQHPQLTRLVHSGAVKGIVSGLGVLDIWIGITELIHYRDYRG